MLASALLFAAAGCNSDVTANGGPDFSLPDLAEPEDLAELKDLARPPDQAPPPDVATGECIEVGPIAISFPDVPVFNRSHPTPVTIRNTCPYPAVVRAIAVEGRDLVAFRLGGVPPLPLQVDGGKSVVVTVEFAPLSIGTASAMLRVMADSPRMVPLVGNGI